MNVCRRQPDVAPDLAAKANDLLPARRRSGVVRGLWLLGVLVASLGGVQAKAQVDSASDLNREYAIKAVYLYHFGRYVQWPPDSFADNRSPLVIGVLGADPFAGILDEIARTKQVEGRPIVIRRFATMGKFVPCHILFVAASVSPEEKAAAIKKTRGMPVLLVGDDLGFAESGGAIGFFLEQNRVRFAINTEVAKQDQLKISSKLLSLAKLVGD